MSTYYIYCIYDILEPDDIAYVGLTENVKYRFIQHSQGSHGTTKNWVKQAFCPCVRVLDSCNNRIPARNLEIFWIWNLNPKCNGKHARSIGPLEFYLHTRWSNDKTQSHKALDVKLRRESMAKFYRKNPDAKTDPIGYSKRKIEEQRLKWELKITPK